MEGGKNCYCGVIAQILIQCTGLVLVYNNCIKALKSNYPIMTTITEKEKYKFLDILDTLNMRCKNLHTQKELSIYLKTSRQKIIDFQKGRIFDFWLLCRYADLLGMEIKFKLCYKN